MPWALVLFLLPLVLFTVFVRRVIRVGRQLRDPERLRSLFSDDVRAALREAGLDPDSVSMQEIQKSEALTRLIAADLRWVLRSVVLGLPLPQSGMSRDAPSLPMDDRSTLPTHGWSPRASGGRAAQPHLPPPIDQSSGPGIRTGVAFALLGLIAVAIFILYSQP